MIKLVPDNDPLLKTPAIEWDFEIDQNPKDIEKLMIELMQENHGIGLAANQIGLLKRIFVIQLRNHPEKSQPFAMFNPKCLSFGNDMESGTEGCLSFPNLWLELQRPREIEVEYYDSQNIKHTLVLCDIDARCFLHELDHLNGICFTDKISRLKLSLAKKKQRKYNGRTK